MRRVVLLVVVALVAAACAAGSEPVSRPGPSPTPASGGSDSGAVAPDFTLALGDGGTFTLSQEARPVYMIFWAEW